MVDDAQWTNDGLTSAIARGKAFDSFIAAAVTELRGDGAKWELANVPTFDTVPFFELLRASCCPVDRAPRLVAMLNDLKLQHYFLVHDVLPLYSHRVDSASARLHEAAVDQKYVVGARIFFERFMNLVYYLERGEELAGRSKKRQFFKMVRASERWRWMESFEPLVDRYDASYRTPEVHSGSFLRRQIESGESSVFWRTVAPQNLVYALFTEVEGVLAGRAANLDNVVSCVASDYMVEGHWQYVPPWDDEEAGWREVLFRVASLAPVLRPDEESADAPIVPPMFGETNTRWHIEIWMLGPGRIEKTETGESIYFPDGESLSASAAAGTQP